MEGEKSAGNRSPSPDIKSSPPVLDPLQQHPDAQHAQRHSIDEKNGAEDTIKTKEIRSDQINGKDSDDGDDDPRGKISDEKAKDDDLTGDEEAGMGRKFRNRWTRYAKQRRAALNISVWLVFTGWWIAGLVLRREQLGWVVPFLVYLAITLRILFNYVPISIVARPMYWIWAHTAVPFVALIPERFQTIAGGALVTGVIIIGAFASEESLDNTRENRAISLFGLLVFIIGLWATSNNRKKIVWRTVIVGMLMQFIIALFVLRSTAGYDIFNFLSERATDLLGFAGQGTEFLTEPGIADMTWFLIGVVPAIIFFVSLVQLLFYIGFLQWFIVKFATFFFWAMRVSGAEAIVAAASPFIGQGESAMLIKPFVNHLTMAEIHQIMCSGFATIAGSVLIAYVGLGINPQALISSCVMSIPASLAVSKMRYPETEETLTAGRVVVPEDDENRPSNALHAFATGAWLGLKIGSMIAATLLCIISLLGLANGLLTWWGRYLTIDDPPLTIELIVGYLCYPIAFLLGVPRNEDLFKVSQLIGVKLIANEFVAYSSLQTDPAYANLSPRSRLIATYALCGFANIGSLGNQIGVLAQLAPRRIGDVSKVALSAMLTGALSTLSSASIAGLLVTDQQQFFGAGGK